MLKESESAKASANVSEIETSSEDESEAGDEKATEGDDKVNEKQETAQVEAEESDEEHIKVANAKAYAAAMHRAAVGGPDNAAALRAKKVLES